MKKKTYKVMRFHDRSDKKLPPLESNLGGTYVEYDLLESSEGLLKNNGFWDLDQQLEVEIKIIKKFLTDLGCPTEEKAYEVTKINDEFFVDGILTQPSIISTLKRRNIEKMHWSYLSAMLNDCFDDIPGVKEASQFFSHVSQFKTHKEKGNINMAYVNLLHAMKNSKTVFYATLEPEYLTSINRSQNRQVIPFTRYGAEMFDVLRQENPKISKAEIAKICQEKYLGKFDRKKSVSTLVRHFSIANGFPKKGARVKNR